MSTSSDFANAAQGLAAALLAAIVNPADGVRLLSELADFTPDAPAGSSAIGQAMATMQDASGDLFRRAAVVALARVSATYQPSSQNDAVNIRTIVCGLLDKEIETAGDQGEDATFNALRFLRQSVVQDLNIRGANLPSIKQFSFNGSLPALVLATRIYRDASRADELLSQANPPHPAFMPRSFKALSR